MSIIKESEVLRWEIVKLKGDMKSLEEKNEKDYKDMEGMCELLGDCQAFAKRGDGNGWGGGGGL